MIDDPLSRRCSVWTHGWFWYPCSVTRLMLKWLWYWETYNKEITVIESILSLVKALSGKYFTVTRALVSLLQSHTHRSCYDGLDYFYGSPVQWSNPHSCFSTTHSCGILEYVWKCVYTSEGCRTYVEERVCVAGRRKQATTRWGSWTESFSHSR